MTKTDKLVKAGNAVIEQVRGYADVDAQLLAAIKEWECVVKSPVRVSKAKPVSEAVPLAKYLLERVRSRSTSSLLTNTTASASGISKILSAGVKPDVIRDTIDWLFDVNAYSDYPFEVQSGRALHMKWDRIQLAMNRQKPVKANGGGYF